MSRAQESERVLRRFDAAEHAARYSSEFDSRRHRRCRRCLVEALSALPPHSTVLDVPCGTGRLLPLVLDLGHVYVGADASAHMVEAARTKREALERERGGALPATLDVEDVMALPYPPGRFDAVVVNRLFHHYTRAETRIAALRELGRVARGPVVVFFLSAWTLRGVKFRLKHAFERPRERVAVSLRTLRAEGRAAGLCLTRTYRTRGRYDKEWYAVFER